MITITEEPSGKTYKSMIEYIATYSKKFILVVRQELDKSEGLLKILDELSPYLLEVEVTNQWPTTITYGKPAKVYHYNSTLETSNILKNRADRLYSWLQPGMPEDLCFFDEKNEPWFTSCSHENFCNINTDDKNDLHFFDNIRLKYQGINK